MRLQVYHRTRYQYGSPVSESFNEARLQPVEVPLQRVHSFDLRISPQASFKCQKDFYQNHVHRFDILGLHQELLVDATSVVTTIPPILPVEGAEVYPLSEMHRCLVMDRCYDFLQPSAYIVPDETSMALAREILQGELDAWRACLRIMTFIHEGFRYQAQVTNAHTTMAEALGLRQGVCQDFANVMIGLCRGLHIPARYVSGYLYNGPADQLRGAQASHAWVEVYLPGLGWLALDPTNAQAAGERHVKLAVGRDYADVSPFKGTYRGTAQRTLGVEVLVTPLEDSPGIVPDLHRQAV